MLRKPRHTARSQYADTCHFPQSVVLPHDYRGKRDLVLGFSRNRESRNLANGKVFWIYEAQALAIVCCYQAAATMH
jgi:hypothetical protein